MAIVFFDVWESKADLERMLSKFGGLLAYYYPFCILKIDSTLRFSSFSNQMAKKQARRGFNCASLYDALVSFEPDSCCNLTK